MAIQLIQHPMPEAARDARVYGGDILVFRRLPAVGRLVETPAAHVRGHLGADPERAHAVPRGAA